MDINPDEVHWDNGPATATAAPPDEHGIRWDPPTTGLDAHGIKWDPPVTGLDEHGIKWDGPPANEVKWDQPPAPATQPVAAENHHILPASIARPAPQPPVEPGGVIPGVQSGDSISADKVNMPPPVPIDPGSHPINAAVDVAKSAGPVARGIGDQAAGIFHGVQEQDQQRGGQVMASQPQARTDRQQSNADAAKAFAEAPSDVARVVGENALPVGSMMAGGAVAGPIGAAAAAGVTGQVGAYGRIFDAVRKDHPDWTDAQVDAHARNPANFVGLTDAALAAIPGAPEGSGVVRRYAQSAAIGGAFTLPEKLAESYATGKPMDWKQAGVDALGGAGAGLIMHGAGEAIGVGMKAIKGTPVEKPSEVKWDDTAQSAEATPQTATDTAGPAPVAQRANSEPDSKTVRFYTGEAGDSGGGPRWFSPDLNYAKEYAEKSASGKVSYIDLPEDHPLLTKSFDDRGTSAKAPYNSFEAPEEIAAQRKPLTESLPSPAQESKPSGQPAPVLNKEADLATATLREPAATTPEAKPPAQPNDVTSARKAMMAKDREALGLAGLNSPDRRTWQQAHDQAHDEGIPDRAMDVAREVQEKGRAMSDVETAGLTQHAAKLKNDHATLMDDIGKLSDPADIKLKSAEAERVQQDFDYLTQAIRTSGTEKGRALASQKLTLNKDYQLVSVLNRAKAIRGDDLPAPDKARFETLTKQLKDRDARIAELEGSSTERQARDALQGTKAQKYSKMTTEQRTAELQNKYAKLQELLRAGCNN